MREDSTISRDIKEVLARWYRDISGLFSGFKDDPDLAFNEEFYRHVIQKKEEFERLSDQEFAQHRSYSSEEINAEISYDEVAFAIDQSKLRKAYLDIPNEALKNPNAKVLLHSFFNLCFINGYNPTDWDFSDIVPIPKKDKDGRDPLQNRCISIICCVAKIYSSILNRRLQNFLEKNQILADEQNGFRAGRSCIDHLFVLCTLVRNRKSMGKDSFLCFIDYKKAFDSVERNLLLFKLLDIGVSGHMYSAIASLYTNPKSRVILQDYSTDYFNCPIGVKQGDCLSPTLFAIFINDLAHNIKESGIGIEFEAEDLAGNMETVVISILMYADDVVLFAKNELDMQSLLDIVQVWCENWRLEVNLAKTNILHIREKRKSQSNYMFIFNKRPVPYCKSYKYLGCCINEHLDFNYSSNIQVDAAGRALNSLICKMIKNKGFPFNVFTTLYQACICSISQYGSEVIGYQKFDSQLKLQLRAARAYLGLPKNVTSSGLLSEVDWLLPQSQSHVRMIQYYHRIMCTPSNRLMYQVYKWDRKLNDQGLIKTWTSEIRSILHDHSLDHIYDQEQIFPLRAITSLLKKSMLQKQRISLKTECHDKPKLRTFVLFKDFECLPPHIGKPLTFVERRILSWLRLGILPLRLETARFIHPIIPEDQRVCYCGTGEVESEAHMLFKCAVYQNLRTKWLSNLTIPDNFNDLMLGEKLILVLNVAENVRHTSQYVLAAMNLRSLQAKSY